MNIFVGKSAKAQELLFYKDMKSKHIDSISLYMFTKKKNGRTTLIPNVNRLLIFFPYPLLFPLSFKGTCITGFYALIYVTLCLSFHILQPRLTNRKSGLAKPNERVLFFHTSLPLFKSVAKGRKILFAVFRLELGYKEKI